MVSDGHGAPLTATHRRSAPPSSLRTDIRLTGPRGAPKTMDVVISYDATKKARLVCIAAFVCFRVGRGLETVAPYRLL